MLKILLIGVPLCRRPKIFGAKILDTKSVDSMTTDQRALLAAHNNAVWCDSVCRAHGTAGTFSDEVWASPLHTLRFYPSLVTITNPADPAGQLAAIRELAAVKTGSGWGVKDSFRALELGPLGFQVAFDAEWIWRAADLPAPAYNLDGLGWAVVRTAAELAAWEAAWDGAPDASIADSDRMFLPTLLQDPVITFIAAYHNQRIVAGAIANRTDAVVGISNTFAPAPESGQFLAGCVAEVMAKFPGLPIVGYERGADLDPMLALGFETIGPLRIWLKE
jgi:hypothetical protein